MTALLEARGVSKVFTTGGFIRKKSLVAVANTSLAIKDDKPSITVIAGESGSGKTTLARLILGIIQPTTGEILYNGSAVSKMDRAQRTSFRREVQAIFQDPFEVFNPFYKVDHSLVLSVSKFGLAKSKADGRDLIEQALRTVGLRPEETLGRYPHQMSGGQRQRVMVARAFLLRPRIIVADEPVSMVDASLRATILDSLLKQSQELGVSLVYITHDLTTAYQLGGNILVMYQGTVVEIGDVELVIKHPQHPYTRLLVSSIPLPNPKLRKTHEKLRTSVDELTAGASQGCRFADRCPSSMPKCRLSPPPLYLTDDKRAAACFLYEEAPAITSEEVARVLT